MTTTVIRFLHPIARRLVTRVLCPSHHATARAVLEDVEQIEGSWKSCEWCEATGSHRDGDKLRERVAREVVQGQIAAAV